MPGRELAVAFPWHTHPFADLLALAQRAEALGYRAIYIDGDVSMIPSLGDAPVLDGWTTTVALLARTQRIEVGSIRLVHHWNAARLAQAVATAEAIAPGRLRFLISIGAQRADRRFGLPLPPPAERIVWLEELLTALRALWCGETVSAAGRHVRLDEVRIRPVPRGGRMPIEVAGRGPRLLQVVAAHADRWDVNLPPLRARVEAAARQLEEACRARGRDPAEIGRSLWVFARPGRSTAAAEVRAEFRRWNPWFREVPDTALERAILGGPPEECRDRIESIRRELSVDLPVIDLAGLDRPACEDALEALAGA
jgi:alkanesulfonate monooxygenase SsuD/methylene tetrahydromethanopterin reductase-like flavin-dependent oxidoreductase (luciferase family)